MNLLLSPNAKAYPMSQKEIAPMQASIMFLIRIFIVFLILTLPTSTRANPACKSPCLSYSETPDLRPANFGPKKSWITKFLSFAKSYRQYICISDHEHHFGSSAQLTVSWWPEVGSFTCFLKHLLFSCSV